MTSIRNNIICTNPVEAPKNITMFAWKRTTINSSVLDVTNSTTDTQFDTATTSGNYVANVFGVGDWALQDAGTTDTDWSIQCQTAGDYWISINISMFVSASVVARVSMRKNGLTITDSSVCNSFSPGGDIQSLFILSKTNWAVNDKLTLWLQATSSSGVSGIHTLSFTAIRDF